MTEVVRAVELVLARHEEALATLRPPRMREATEGLLRLVEDELPAALDAGGEDRARDVVDRRLSEAEGLLLQLRLALHAPLETLEAAARLAALLGALRRALDALRAALRLHAGIEGHAPMPHALLDAARACLRAGAPEAAAPALGRALALGLGAPLGLEADASAADALDAWRARAAAPRFDLDEAARVAARLADDAAMAPVDAWRALDAVERLVNLAAMSR